MAYVLNPKTGLLEDDRIIGQKQVTNPWGQTGTLRYGATNANGQQFQTFTPNKIAPTVPADTFDNRSNPNSAWVYNGNGKWNNDKTGEVKNLVNGQDPNFSPPSTITSQPANDYVSGLKDYLTKSQAQFEEQQRQLEEQRKQRTAEFESLFAGEQKRLSQTQQEESATNKALQFRLGRSDTSYGAGEIEKLNQEHAFQQSQLQAKKAQALNELNNAINDKNFTLASQMRKEYKDALKEEADMRRQQQEDYVKLVNAQTASKKASREEAQAISEDFAPNIYEAIKANPEMDFANVINDYANQSGVNPILLSSAVIKYKNDREKENILNSKNSLDYLQNVATATGQNQTTTLPGVGKVTLTPKKDTTLIEAAGGALYSFDKQTNAVTLLPIKKEQFGIDKIFDALKFISEGKDPSGFVNNFLADQGVNLPGQGSVSFRNNNPLNIKMGNFASKYGAIAGTQATDGGVFARFPTVEAGEQAAKDLLTSPSYANLPLEQAMRRWSGNGYGADVAPTSIRNKTISQMNSQEVNLLFNSMKQREGWTPGTQTNQGQTPADIAKTIFDGSSTIDVKSLPTSQRAEVDKELVKLKNDALKSGDFVGLMRASAGGKEVDATFIQNFDKGLNVIQQIGDLQTAIEKESTGPILGIIRSNNPYDTKAQKIKAEISSIVPNLARGVYGEVGVLTDNDIANYSKTLPNLKSTTEVRDAILGMTIRSVQRSLENKLRSQANFSRDVSGAIDTYQQVKQTAERLLPLEILAQDKKFSVQQLQDARTKFSDDQIRQILISQ